MSNKTTHTSSMPKQKRQREFDSLNGLRFFLFIPIFFLHATTNRDIWLAPTMYSLDYFFVLSGFMAAVGRYDSACNISGWKTTGLTTIHYLKKKLQTFYPIHITCFLMIVALWFCSPPHAGYMPKNTEQWWQLTAANLLLLQDWSWRRDIKFCFNGTSWFLSCLMFCFAMTPILLRVAAKLVQRFGYWIVWWLIIGAVCIKLPLFIFDSGWELSKDFTKIFLFDAHSWPPFRLIDYTVGMCAGIWWKIAPEKRLPGTRTQIWSSVLISAALIALVVYDLLPQPIALLLIAGGIWGMAASSSILANCLRSRFLVFMGSLVMPVYLSHNVFLKLLAYAHVNVGTPLRSTLFFVLCFLLGFGWMKLEKWVRLCFSGK